MRRVLRFRSVLSVRQVFFFNYIYVHPRGTEPHADGYFLRMCAGTVLHDVGRAFDRRASGRVCTKVCTSAVRFSRRFTRLVLVRVSMETALRLPESPFHLSLTPSPLDQRWPPRRRLCKQLLIILHFEHPIDRQCLGRLYKDNSNRSFQKSLR